MLGNVGAVLHVREDGPSVPDQVNAEAGQLIEQHLGVHTTDTRTVFGRDCCGGKGPPRLPAGGTPSLSGVTGVTGSDFRMVLGFSLLQGGVTSSEGVTGGVTEEFGM